MQSNSAVKPDLLEQIRRLERELHELRRSVEPRRDFPSRDFTALLIGVAGAWYAIDIEPVSEVVAMAWPDPIPEAPAWIRGTLTYGDSVVPVVDVNSRLGGRLAPASVEHRIVLAATPRLTGFVVDQLGGLTTVSATALIPPPEGIPQAPYIVAATPTAAHGIVNILSLERLSHDFIAQTQP